MQCAEVKPNGERCQGKAYKNGRCLIHIQKAAAAQMLKASRAGDDPKPLPPVGIFALSRDEISRVIESLTRRQREALEYLCRGMTNAEASEELGINDGSFSTRITHAAERAGVESRLQLIAMYAIWRYAAAGVFPGKDM